MAVETLTDTRIQDIVAKYPPEEAASLLLEEMNGIKPNSRVAVIDDDATMPYAGLVGTVTGKCPDDAGYAHVQFASGKPVPVQVNQLIPVPSGGVGP
jgi:hypothetical protein